MGSLYNFDAELKKRYPDSKTFIDSKVIQKLMEEIIYEEPSLDFIKSYLKDKGYLFIDSLPTLDTTQNTQLTKVIQDEEIYKAEDIKKAAVITESCQKYNRDTATFKKEIDSTANDNFNLDDFLESDDFKTKMENNDKILGYKYNKSLFLNLALKDSEETRNNILVTNYPLVKKIASKYVYASTGSLVYDDLVSEGVLGLMKAIDRYELDYGYEFSTYAYYWIKQSITRAIADKALTIRLPVHIQESLNKINKLERNIWREDGEPEVEKIAKLCDISEEKYYELKIIEATYRRQTSLNTPLKEDSQEDILMMLEQKSSIWSSGGIDMYDPIQVSNLHILQEELKKLISHLTEREEQVIRLRFGFDDEEPRTLEEIGKLFNVTRERIRQIEAKAIRKLREKSKRLDLLLFLEN